MTIESVDQRRILSVAASVGIVPDQPTLARLSAFGDLFLRWNARVNLGGQIDATELVDRHYLDAAAAARFVSGEVRVIDVGSGGGLPVIPLALLRPQAQFQLFEPVGKKATFLRTAVHELSLGGGVVVNQRRVETVDGFKDARFDVAMSRATFDPVTWLALGRRLITDAGVVLVFATADPPAGMPLPLADLAYAPNRRILTYR